MDKTTYFSSLNPSTSLSLSDPNTEKEMTQMNKTEIQWSIYTNIGNKVERQYLIYVQDLMQTCVAGVKVLSDGDYKKSKEADLSKRQMTALTI